MKIYLFLHLLILQMVPQFSWSADIDLTQISKIKDPEELKAVVDRAKLSKEELQELDLVDNLEVINNYYLAHRNFGGFSLEIVGFLNNLIAQAKNLDLTKLYYYRDYLLYQKQFVNLLELTQHRVYRFVLLKLLSKQANLPPHLYDETSYENLDLLYQMLDTEEDSDLILLKKHMSLNKNHSIDEPELLAVLKNKYVHLIFTLWDNLIFPTIILKNFLPEFNNLLPQQWLILQKYGTMSHNFKRQFVIKCKGEFTIQHLDEVFNNFEVGLEEVKLFFTYHNQFSQEEEWSILNFAINHTKNLDFKVKIIKHWWARGKGIYRELCVVLLPHILEILKDFCLDYDCILYEMFIILTYNNYRAELPRLYKIIHNHNPDLALRLLPYYCLINRDLIAHLKIVYQQDNYLSKNLSQQDFNLIIEKLQTLDTKEGLAEGVVKLLNTSSSLEGLVNISHRGTAIGLILETLWNFLEK